MGIRIENHILQLVNTNEDAYTQYLDELMKKLSVNQPFSWMIKGSINNASKAMISYPNRNELLQKLLEYDLTHTAHSAFTEITRQLPSPVEEVVCHILPAIDSKGGGACYAPGQILLMIRADELSPVRLKRNLAHEYSHTLRFVRKPLDVEFGFGDAVPYSIRDFLILEGLASVLAENLFPHPNISTPEVSEEQEADFWEKADLNAVGMDAYIKYMHQRAYEIGSRIVRSYLTTHSTSIIAAHKKSDEELYWESGYSFIR